MTLSDNIFSIDNLSISYGQSPVLKLASCTIGSGEMIGIIGEEGSGKSTLVNAIVQSLDYQGNITYKNQRLKSYKTYQLSQIGIDYLPQGGSIFKNFTVQEHIDLAQKRNQNSLSEVDVWNRIELYFPKLPNMRKRLGGTLSGGERIMLSLSCLLVSDCEMLLLDEPTSGLSPQVCMSIKPLFKKWHQQGKTILMTEHNYDFVIELCDAILLLKDGFLSPPYEKAITTKSNFIETYLYNFVND